MRQLVFGVIIANIITGVMAQTPARDRPAADAHGGHVSGRVVATR